MGVSGLAGGVVGVASKQYQPCRPIHLHDQPPSVANNRHPYFLPQSIRQNGEGLKLWSVNGGGQDDAKAVEVEESNDDDDAPQMTLKKASKLLSTFWSMAYPYYEESQPGRRLFYGMILLTLMNSG